MIYKNKNIQESGYIQSQAECREHLPMLKFRDGAEGKIIEFQ
jgi:hypothetical protein